MRFAVYAALLLAMCGPVALSYGAARLQPRTAAWTVALGSVICGAAWLLGLAALSVVTLGRFAVVADVGGWSARSLRSDSPVPVLVGLAAVLLLALAIGRLGIAVARIGRGLHGLRRLRAATPRTDGEWCVVVESATPEAVTVPGWPGTVIISSGMLDALAPNQHPVLLAHERCHLQARHWLFQLGARLGAAVLPSGRNLATTCDQALEEWADESAASVVGDRRLVAETVAKAAFATTAHARPQLGTGMADGVVVHRVESLLQPRRRTRRIWFASIVGGLAFLAVTAGEAARDADALLDLARRTFG
jgi:hypothetical protein